jgi:hypothetical protein
MGQISSCCGCKSTPFLSRSLAASSILRACGVSSCLAHKVQPGYQHLRYRHQPSPVKRDVSEIEVEIEARGRERLRVEMERKTTQGTIKLRGTRNHRERCHRSHKGSRRGERGNIESRLSNRSESIAENEQLTQRYSARVDKTSHSLPCIPGEARLAVVPTPIRISPRCRNRTVPLLRRFDHEE